MNIFTLQMDIVF